MARQIAERMQHPYSIGWAHSTTAHVYMEMGNWNMARTHSERAIEAIRAAGQPAPLLHTILAVSARVLADLDESGLAASRAEEAERLYERAVARGRRGGWTPILTALSKAYLRLGRLDDARRTVRALENAPPTAAADTYAMYLEAEIAAHPEAWDPQIAQDRYGRTLTLAERQGLRPLVAHSHLGLGVLLRGLGDQRQARRHIAAAVTRYRAMNMASWIERAETERGLIGPESTG
jgi:tetratricopeptide (TPR) repeat protein